MEKILLAIMMGVFGLVVGSFLNVCIYRIPLKKTIVSGRSFCPSCKHDLKALDLFPVFSYIFLGGKCRYCREKISPRYPIIEILNGMLWTGAAYKFGLTANLFLYCVFFSVLIIAAMIDYDTMEIPYVFQAMILIVAIIALILEPNLWKEKLIGAVAISVPMALIAILFNGFGGADIQLMAISGLFLGWKNIIVAFLIGVILAGIYGIIFMFKRKEEETTTEDLPKEEVVAIEVDAIEENDDIVVTEEIEILEETSEEEVRGTQIPFGPFLAIGLAIATFWGEQLISWYLNMFNF